MVMSSKEMGKLDPVNCADKFDEFFTCSFCLMVVHEPQECAECEALFCKDCV